MHRGLLQDGIDDVLCSGEVDGVLYVRHIGNNLCRIEGGIREELKRMLQGGAVQQAGVVEEVGIAQIVPLTAGIAEVARRTVFEALEGVLHDDLAVLDPIVGGREFEPPATGAVIGRRRVFWASKV